MPAPRINPVFRARIEKGALRWFGIEGKRFNVLKQKFEGKDVEIVLRLPQKKTTGPQRRYYFGVLVAMIAEAVGEDKEAVHEELKQMFLKDRSKAFPVTRSTESLTTVEREEYHEKIRRWAASFLGLYLPLPNEVDMESITA
jgi:hypothetical protein